MFDRSADLAVESIVIGMSHRGRLNVLGNVFRKPLRQIFSEFSGGIRPIEEVGLYTRTSDVKYHFGTSYDRPIRGGKRIHLSLVANPSHLEALDPLCFVGQGVVYETLHLSALPNYTTGGTIHIVVNNQVAFTTDPKSGRSSQDCTDVAKALNALIFHVNGDDVETVVHACELATEWRQTVKPEILKNVGKAISTLPETFKPHRAVNKV
ncbi:2-oxoglutarate dehydrogenase, mitochondrial-like protein [Tanacetum coccineum]